jgi:hypothetical protein
MLRSNNSPRTSLVISTCLVSKSRPCCSRLSVMGSDCWRGAKILSLMPKVSTSLWDATAVCAAGSWSTFRKITYRSFWSGQVSRRSSIKARWRRYQMALQWHPADLLQAWPNLLPPLGPFRRRTAHSLGSQWPPRLTVCNFPLALLAVCRGEIFGISRRARSAKLSSHVAVQRYHFRPGLQIVEMVSPLQHHFPPLGKMRRPIVGTTVRIAHRTSELMFNVVRADP